MERNEQAVGSTADGLVVLRAGDMAREAGVDDPFAAWFVTEAGRRLAGMATAVDPVYREFNLARYLHTSAALAGRAGSFAQVVLLGAGFDCRALMPGPLADGHARVFEVDTRGKLDEKLGEFGRRGLRTPDWIRHLACDLCDERLPGELRAAGFDPATPALVLAEGVTFYLPPEVATRMLDPRGSGLARGSLVAFDCWSATRVAGLNARVAPRIGTRLFQTFPCPVDDAGLRTWLTLQGYSAGSAVPLASIAAARFPHAPADAFADSWWMVEAVV